ncbi:MAG: SLC13 family permease [Candidatus Omnitrophica bacterium]|nr:SLC13 family permease [Candidatus Omnitrophota bacterium]
MDPKALISIGVFIICYFLIAVEHSPRVYIALAGSFLLVLLKIYTPKEVALYVDWETIGFLFGIFITVKIIEKSGFFNYFSLLLARKLNFNPIKVFIFFPFLACILSSIMGSITVITFLAPLTYALSKILRFDPVIYIVAEVCLANIGGAGTVMGDPPNVVLASMFNLGFTDFLKHNWILSIIAAWSAIGVFYLLHRKTLLKLNNKIKKEELKKVVPEEAIEDRFLMKGGLLSLLVTVLLLIGRDFLREMLPVNIALASLIPSFTLLAIKGHYPKLKGIIKEIDMETLLFLTGLFVIVGALEKTWVMRTLAFSIKEFANHPLGMVGVIFWGGAFTSGIIDNVPEAISLGYVIKNLVPLLSYSFTLLIWAASLGLDIGGNFTPVGASANVVGYTFLEEHQGRIGWGRWFKLTILPNLAALLICVAGLILKYIIGFY